MLYEWWRGRRGLGMGDVKLAAVAGVWLDWFTIVAVIEFAALAALVACHPKLRSSEGWLGREGSNLRMPESKSGALPLGDAPSGKGADHRGAALGFQRKPLVMARECGPPR